MLYPPYIEGTIPSFYGNSLTVPFSMNKSVSASDVQGFSLKLKTIQSTKYLFTTTDVIEQDLNSEYYVKFDISSYAKKLTVGQHYKVQIAYIGSDGVGYYSTVGIIKYTSKPSVSIEGLKSGKINGANQSYIGVYNSSNDRTEKEYKYKFIFSDNAHNVIKETDWEIHNNSNDETSYLTHDEFLTLLELEKNEVYYIQYKVITNNNLELSSPKYRVSNQLSIDPDINITLNAEMRPDNGYVLLTMEGELNEQGEEEKVLDGAFLICRACEDSDFKEWDELSRFKTRGKSPADWSFKDFTVQQGKEYIYSFQQYNDFDIYSDRILSNVIFADFEDIFLYDGTRQLKVSYNPQVSSFKTDILETKMDTIGSKYPFFFRNGSVEYKEFSLNGLISYLSDEEHLFITDEELGLSPKVEKMTRSATVVEGFEPDDQYFFDKQYYVNAYELKESYADDKENREILDSSRFRTTQLTGFNMSAERAFKLKVLEWLNNGEPKLFRSPGEGNYMVRLMNISLSPEDTLSRMLHSFSCTAYEIDECTYESLNNYGIISVNSPESKQLKFKTILLKDHLNYLENLISDDYAVTIRFENMSPGDKIFLTTEDSRNNTSIVIGATGNYLVDTGTKIFQAWLSRATLNKYNNQTLNSPMITYSYYDSVSNAFSNIRNITLETVAARQFVGENTEIISELDNSKETLISFYYLHFMKRDIIELELPKVDAVYSRDGLRQIVEENGGIDFFLYKFSLPEFEQSIKRYKKIETPVETDFIFNRYNYYVLENNEYKLTQKYDTNTTYYILNDDITAYYDPNCNRILLSQEDYDYLKSYLPSGYLETCYQVYDTRAKIDKNYIDLKDDGELNISGPCLFSNLQISNGVILEAGYSQQITTYSLEIQNETLNWSLECMETYLNASIKYLQQGATALAEQYYNLYKEVRKLHVVILAKLKEMEE